MALQTVSPSCVCSLSCLVNDAYMHLQEVYFPSIEECDIVVRSNIYSYSVLLLSFPQLYPPSFTAARFAAASV